jgi:sortase A
LLVIAGVILIGAGAVLDKSPVDRGQIERQRQHFEQLEQAQTPMSADSQSSSRTALDDGPATSTSSAAASGQVGQLQSAARFHNVTIESDTQPEAPATPATTPTPEVVDMPPATHIAIPAVGIDADIQQIEPKTETLDGQLVLMWPVVDWAAGHHSTSADPGEGGNIVLAGHDDVRGEVFRGLHDIDLGDEVQLTSPTGTHRYVVVEVHLRRERDAALSDRLASGEFMAPMPEERLTLITCWPYGVDDHRLIVVAKPVTAPTDGVDWVR